MENERGLHRSSRFLTVLGASFHDAARSSFYDEEVPLNIIDSLSERRRKERLRILAISLCFASVVLNLVLSVLGFVFASIRHSPATFAFAVDCVLDLLSSSIVIWRYFGSPYRLYSATRENAACISLGILFIAAGIGVIIEGSYFLITKDVPKWFTVLIILSGVGFGTCLLQSLAKFIMAKKMKSETLFLDGLNSILSALFALVIIISDIVYLYNTEIWFLDPVMSIVLSLAMLCYGMHTIMMHCRGSRNVTCENFGT